MLMPFQFTALLLLTPHLAVQEHKPTYQLGSEVLVSQDGNFPHVEIDAEVNPANPLNMIAGAITTSRPQGGYNSKVYYTKDGGETWNDVVIPDQFELGGADPIVTFDSQGTAYFFLNASWSPTMLQVHRRG